MSAPIATTCPYCGVGCGLSARAHGERDLVVDGDKAHPANFGRLCAKGHALGATVSLDGRLLHPLIAGAPARWSEATALVAAQFKDVIGTHGPEAIAFYVSGQLLTEDYYAANKLMKGFIGAANIDTNSRLCMASAVAAHTSAFGADLAPACYEDLDLADLVVFAGHNCAWTHPVLFRRTEAARRARGQRHIVIDPRRTDTAHGADLHLALAPQSDVRLWNGLLAHLIACGAVDRSYVAAHVAGYAQATRDLARDDQSAEAVAADCGLSRSDVAEFFSLFAQTERVVSLFSMGVNQSAQGVNKALAIINAHLATGRIGKLGAGPFSMTGQPNAMGGREVGGLATALAAHMDFDPASRARVGRFWRSDRVAAKPGLKAVDMFEAVRDGRIRALWIMATNPAVSMPDANLVREALQACPFVVLSECALGTDTAAYAHVLLPALAWGERDGTVTNSERRISRQRPVFAPPGEARADWRIVADVAAAMGFADQFSWAGPAQVFAEYAALTRFENDGARPLNLDWLADLTPAAYDALAPIQWPITREGGRARLFEDGRYAHDDGRARMSVAAAHACASPCDDAFPFALNTGRVRDQWHTMTRTGLAAELCRHTPEPTIAVNPADARALALEAGALARVRSRHGEAVLSVEITDRQRPGEVFAPMHWTEAFAPRALANALVGPNRDPLSGQPEFKHTPVRIEPFSPGWRAFVVDRTGVAKAQLSGSVWRRITERDCVLYEVAGAQDADGRAFLDALACGDESIVMDDAARGMARRAYFTTGRLMRVVMWTRAHRLPARDWIAARFSDDTVGDADRAALLLGRTAAFVDLGGTVCACAGVRARTIEDAIEDGALDPDQIGAATRAGVRCGACRPELVRMIGDAAARAASPERIRNAS